MNTWAPWFLWGLTAFWCSFTATCVLALRGVRTLPDLQDTGRAGAGGPSTGPGDRAPRVTVIIAARDEQEQIGDTVERVLRQDGVDIELTIVDDRSTDDTPRILNELARRHARLTILRVDDLPPGWLGKNHACHLASRQASGDWLLFSDADAGMSSDLVARAVRAAQREGVEHVAIFPGEERATLWAKATLTLIMVSTAPVPALVNLDTARIGAGVGAFNLVRADAYRKTGGYERLRLEVIDDLKLGLLMRRAGMRTRIYDASHDLKVHWAGDLAGLVHAVEKNMFALFGFNTLLAALGVIVPMAVWSTTLLAPLLWPAPGPAALLPPVALATTWLPAAFVARRGRLGFLAGLLSPLTVPVLAAMIFHSTVKTLRMGGIRWRNTFYPLDELRRRRAREGV